MERRTILQACLSAAARYYRVPMSEVKDERNRGERMGEEARTARAAYLWLAKRLGLSGYSAAEFIGMNKGNATTYRKAFERQITKGQKDDLFEMVDKRIVETIK